MSSVLRSLCAAICHLIYPLIPDVYDLFYDLASGKFFTDDLIQTLSNNLYILVSVAMLFVFVTEMIKTIINPDIFVDKQKGTMAIVKRVFLSVVLIAAIPVGFRELYEIQSKILDNQLIEKIVMGIGNSNGNDIAKKTGNYLTGITIYTVLFPIEDATSSNETLNQSYNDLIVGKNIDSNFDVVSDSINEKSENGEYIFQFYKLPAIVIGFFIVYQLILFSLDMALRMIKMGFLEISAPVSVIAYIIQGKPAIERWFKELMSTYAGVFIKIASLSFMVVGLQALQNFLYDDSKNWLFKLLVIAGLLMFIQQLPQLIQSLFGIKIDSKGGLKGRLSSMGAVGAIASKAIQHPVQTLGKIGGAGAGVVGNARGAAARGRQIAENMRENGHGRVRSALAGIGVGVGSGILNTPGAMVRGFQQGRGVRQYGTQRDRYRDTHPEDSTLRGRIANTIRDQFGNETAADRMDRDFARRIRTAERANLQIFDRNPDGTIKTDASGAPIVKRELTQAEAAEEKQNLENQKRDIQAVSTKNSAAVSKMKEARDRAKTLALKANSSVTAENNEVKDANGNVFKLKGNLNSWKNQIEAFKNQAPKQENYIDASTGQLDFKKYQAAMQEHSRMLSEFQKAYDRQEKVAIEEQFNSLIGGSDELFNTAVAEANQALNATTQSGKTISNIGDFKTIKENLQNEINANNERVSIIDNGQMADILQAEQDYNDNIANVKASIESEKQGDAYRREAANRESFKAGHGGGTNTNNNAH